MFKSRNGRKVEKGQLVGVHYNAHRNTWSVVEMKSRKTVGLVLGYTDAISLIKCTVKIDKAKQRLVRNKQHKDRHAFIVGYVDDIGKFEILENSIYYNPYKLESFVDATSYLFNRKAEYLEYMERVNLQKKENPIVTYTKGVA